MNINHLKAFVKVVQTGSFKEAASELCVTQPAITQRIQALEEHFGTRLLNRDSEGIQLTTTGQYVYQKCQEILQKWSELEQYFFGMRLSGNLVIGASTIPSEYFLPGMIKQFREIYPEIHINLRISGTGEVLKWLTERTVDIAITGQPGNAPHLYSQPIFSDHLAIIAPTGLSWEKRIKGFSDLTQFDWVLREPQSDTRRTWEKELKKRGLSLDQFHIVGQLGSTEAIIAAVEAGIGISVVSSLAAKRAAEHHRVITLPIETGEIMRSFYFCCMEENKDLPLIRTFVEFMLNLHPELLD